MQLISQASFATVFYNQDFSLTPHKRVVALMYFMPIRNASLHHRFLEFAKLHENHYWMDYYVIDCDVLNICQQYLMQSDPTILVLGDTYPVRYYQNDQDIERFLEPQLSYPYVKINDTNAFKAIQFFFKPEIKTAIHVPENRTIILLLTPDLHYFEQVLDLFLREEATLGATIFVHEAPDPVVYKGSAVERLVAGCNTKSVIVALRNGRVQAINYEGATEAAIIDEVLDMTKNKKKA